MKTTYALSMRKYDSSEVAQSAKSSGSLQEHLSTGFSSRDLLPAHFDSDQSISWQEGVKNFPLTKSSSKVLQQQISKSSPRDLIEIVSALKPNISELMIDVYGNYLCQTLFHTCSAEQRLELLIAMKGSFVNIAFHSRGTHALQNLIAMTNLKEEEEIYHEEFSGKILLMIRDVNASHVLQKLLTSLRSRYFIIREIIGHVKELALDKLGVCVLKKCCNDPEIMNEILGDLIVLMQHPYGNYEVQSILEIWKEEVGYEFNSAIQGRVAQLCLQKYASNVIEKALVIEVVRDSIIRELLTYEKIKELVCNQYGCYVLRTLSLNCEKSDKEKILPEVKKGVSVAYVPKLKPLWQEITKNLSR